MTVLRKGSGASYNATSSAHSAGVSKGPMTALPLALRSAVTAGQFRVVMVCMAGL